MASNLLNQMEMEENEAKHVSWEEKRLLPSSKQRTRSERFVDWLDGIGDDWIHGVFDRESAEAIISLLCDYHHFNKRKNFTTEEWARYMYVVGILIVFGKLFNEVSAMVIYAGFMSVYDYNRALFYLSGLAPIFITGFNIYVNMLLLEGTFRWTEHFNVRCRIVSFVSNIFHLVYLFLVIAMGWVMDTWIVMAVCVPYSIITCMIPAYWMTYEILNFKSNFQIKTK